MARSFTEEGVVKQLEALLRQHMIEANVTKEQFCATVGIFPTAYYFLFEDSNGCNAWSPAWCYRIWDAFNLPTPKVTWPDVR